MKPDDLDIKILSLPGRSGRYDLVRVGQSVLGLSPPAAADRVKRLEEQGIITGYTARLNAEGLGLDLTAFIAVYARSPPPSPGFFSGQWQGQCRDFGNVHPLSPEMTTIS